MPIAMCVWCRRSRVCELRTWRSPRTGEQLVGEVCKHCYFGGLFDDCRTCRAKQARGQQLQDGHGVRPLTSAEALEILRRSEHRRSRPNA